MSTPIGPPVGRVDVRDVHMQVGWEGWPAYGAVCEPRRGIVDANLGVYEPAVGPRDRGLSFWG